MHDFFNGLLARDVDTLFPPGPLKSVRARGGEGADQPEAGCGGSNGFEGLADVLEQPIGLAKGAGLGGAEGS
jgi:hypothetical protein